VILYLFSLAKRLREEVFSAKVNQKGAVTNKNCIMTQKKIIVVNRSFHPAGLNLLKNK
jgi:hypothetical protein